MPLSIYTQLHRTTVPHIFARLIRIHTLRLALGAELLIRILAYMTASPGNA